MNKLNKSLIGIIVLFLLCVLFSCASTPPPSSSSGSTAAKRPEWVNKPYSEYPEALYIAQVGDGKTTEEAQYKARANLLSYFGMEMVDKAVIDQVYQETNKNGAVSFTDTTNSNRRISASAEGILVGCQIKQKWNNASGTEHQALAVMTKSDAVKSYSEMILSWKATIDNAIKDAPKNTLDGYTRYKYAALLAKDTEQFSHVLQLVGGAANIPAGLKTERDYKLEMDNVIKATPIGVTVKNDKAGRVQGAFKKALTDVGFRTDGTNPRYTLNVTITLVPDDRPGNPMKFARLQLDAQLTDTVKREVLVPYNLNIREGGAAFANAEETCFRRAENIISTGDSTYPDYPIYKNAINAYLAQLSNK